MASGYVSTQEASDRLGIGAHAVRARLKKGSLRGKKHGREHLVLEADLPAKSPRKDTALPAIDADEPIPNYEESRARNEYWKAKQAELKYRTEAGQLVDAAAVAATYANEAITCREKLRLIPDRLRSRVKVSEQAIDLLRALIDESLEDLGRGAPG